MEAGGPQQTPPGWYPDPQGAGQRYWDGRQWTEQRAPAAQQPVYVPPQKKRGGTV